MTEDVPDRPEPGEFSTLPRLDLSAFPPPVTAIQLEQWDTLCSVATSEGLCTAPAVDPDAALRICGPHLGLAVMVAIDQLEAAEAKSKDDGGDDHA